MVVRVGNTFYTIRIQPVLAAVAVILVLWGLRSAVFTVQAEEQGIVLRFGKYLKTVEPGLRFKIPYGVDSVMLVPVRRQLKQEFGFGTPGATNKSQYSGTQEQQEQEKSMVSGDLNAATVEWVIQYRISDPKEFLFNVYLPEATLRDASESVMREVVGDRTVDEVITIGRQEIESEALTKLQTLVKKYGLGIGIDQVQLKNVNPPPRVQPSFNEVNQAQQEREKLINIANGEYNKTVPRARGEAEGKIRNAEGYAIKRVNEAEGDANRFNAVFKEYSKAPEVTRTRIYLETIETVMPQLGRKIILDDAAKQVLPLLQLQEGGGR